MSSRVVIVDPQPFFCEALACGLERAQHLSVAGWLTDEREAEHLVQKTRPDLVLTELELDRGSGLSLIRKIRDLAPAVVLTRAHEGDVLLEAVGAGAIGCLNHDLDLERLSELIAAGIEGRFVANHDRLLEVMRRVAANRSGARAPSKLDRLTAREREILALLSRGSDNDDIARELYLSVNTVRTHIGNILKKLEVHSRAEAARIALREMDAQRAEVLRIEGPNLGSR